jgi:hypothetical protein
MTHAQEATPSTTAPVVYDGLTFPELPYASRWIESQRCSPALY